jgi:hypothetical protein
MAIGILRAAYVERLNDDMFTHKLVDRVCDTDLAKHDEKLLNDIVEPMSDTLNKQWNEFKHLSPQEQNRTIFAIVSENIATIAVNEGIGFASSKLAQGGARIISAMSDVAGDAKTAAALTPEGLQIPVQFGEIGEATDLTGPLAKEMAAVNKANVDRIIISEKTYSTSGNEIILPRVKTFEQARNKTTDMLDGIIGCDSKPFIDSLETSAGYNKVIGRVSADNKVRWRLNWDKPKGIHINIENFRVGKGCNAQKIVIPFEGTEETYKSLLKHLNT